MLNYIFILIVLIIITSLFFTLRHKIKESYVNEYVNSSTKIGNIRDKYHFYESLNLNSTAMVVGKILEKRNYEIKVFLQKTPGIMRHTTWFAPERYFIGKILRR